MSDLMLLVLILSSVCLYVFPSIVAANRKHKNGNAIFILNLFLGWTFLGWIVALIWAFTDNTEKARMPS